MKTKTIVRVFAILLAIMMMSSLLVACNGDKNKKPGSQANVRFAADDRTTHRLCGTFL